MQHLVFVDESGDHNLKRGGDPEYPVFVLVAVIINEETYRKNAIPKFRQLKECYFGNDSIVLHEYDIRKAKGVFEILRNPSIRDSFYADVSRLIAELDFKLIASIIDKRNLIQSYRYPKSPYDLALEFVLERVYMELRPRKEQEVILESRGKKEDQKLKEVFQGICDGRNAMKEKWPFSMVFRRKQDNDLGLQIADLVARPIGRWYLNKEQHNRAYQIIQTKLRRSPEGKILGFGLKIFPDVTKSE